MQIPSKKTYKYPNRQEIFTNPSMKNFSNYFAIPLNSKPDKILSTPDTTNNPWKFINSKNLEFPKH